MLRRAVVLGGGGVTGVAWEVGLLLGLAEAGVDLGAADLLVGTSAGSVVAAQVASGLPLKEMFARQVLSASGGSAHASGGATGCDCCGHGCAQAGTRSVSGPASAHWPAPPAPCPRRIGEP
jgi:hypothetical protein